MSFTCLANVAAVSDKTRSGVVPFPYGMWVLVAVTHTVVAYCYTRSLLLLQLFHLCTYTHPFNGPFSGTTQVSRYQKGKTNRDFTEARNSEWQWYQLGHMQVCTSLQTDNHASTPVLCFLQAECPSCRPTKSVKALRAFIGAVKVVKIVEFG